MIYFWLTLTLAHPDQPAADYRVALTIDKSACTVAGAGMAIVLQEANPGLTVTWRCDPAEASGEPA